MSDTEQDRKTEEPTPRHLQKAREQGQVAKSKDFTNFGVLSLVLLCLWAGRSFFIEQFHLLGNIALHAPETLDAGDEEVAPLDILIQTAIIVVKVCLPVIIVAGVSAASINMVQTRGLFAPAALTPKFDKLNPVSGFKNLFSQSKLVELLKSIAKMLVVGTTMYYVILGALPNLVHLPYASLLKVAVELGSVLGHFYAVTIVAFGCIAIFDFWYQKFDYMRRQRMTPEQVKRERREDQGDPHIKSERRSFAFEALQESLLERTASATLMVRASAPPMVVALIVDPEGSFTPWLVNKGTDDAANAILAVARDKQIRVVSDVRLASMIFEAVAIDADLPKELAARVTALVAD